MVTSNSLSPNYLTRLSDGTHEILADIPPEHGGQNAGFKPHDLLEAALASCMAMTVRVAAAHHNIPLTGVSVSVSLDGSDPAEAVFSYTTTLEGDLTEQQRASLLRAVNACPVKKTLNKKLVFQQLG